MYKALSAFGNFIKRYEKMLYCFYTVKKEPGETPYRMDEFLGEGIIHHLSCKIYMRGLIYFTYYYGLSFDTIILASLYELNVN